MGFANDKKGGGGGGAVHTYICQSGDPSLGIEIALLGEDATWKLDAVQRADADAPSVEIDARALLVTVAYDVADDPVDLIELFKGKASAVLIGETADDAELEPPPFTRVFRGVRSDRGAVHASIGQSTDATKGIEAALIGGDATWKLEGVQRETGTRGYVDFRGGLTPGNYVRLTAPTHFTLEDDQQQELANGWDVRVERGTDRVPEVAAIAEVIAVAEVRANVHLFFGAGVNELMNIQRAAAGADGNDWDIRFSTFAGAVGASGVQLSVVGTEFQVLISSTAVPSARTVRNAINNEADFTADFVAGSEPAVAVLMTTVLATALPNGTTTGTDRFEDFTGGVDAVDAVAGVDAIPSVPPEDPTFSGNLPETNDVARWELLVNDELTLDELAEFLETAEVGIHTDFVDGDDHGVVEFGAANVAVVGDGSVTLRSSGHSLNGVPGSLPAAVGDTALHELDDAVNATPPEVAIDDDTKIVEVSYDASDDASDIRDLFKGKVVAVLVGDTEDDARLEAPSFSRPFRGAGVGGSFVSAKIIEIASVTFEEESVDFIDFTEVNVAVDTGIPVPPNTKTIGVNYGASTDADLGGIDLPWFPIPIEEWDRLEGLDVGDGPTQANARFTRTWRDTDIATAGGVMARQVWIGKGNNGNVFVFSDNVIYDIHPFRVRFEIHTIVEVVTGVSGTRDQVTSLAPRAGVQVYDAADEHHIVNVDGKPYEVQKKHTDGHAKVVVPEDLTDTRFRGFVTIVNDVDTPLADEFVYVKAPGNAGGGFEKYSAGSPTGFFPGYNPFAPGEPWETAPTGDDIDYAGDLEYHGHVLNEANMERNANAAGEAYVLLQEERVVFVDEYTPPDSGETVYFGAPLIPRYFNNPVAYWYLAGQTERLPATFPFGPVYGVGDELNRARIQFAAHADSPAGAFRPHDIYHVESDDYFDGIFKAEADISADADLIGAVANRDLEFFQPFRGIWRTSLRLLHQTYDPTAAVGLVRTKSGTDDVVEAGGSIVQTGGSAGFITLAFQFRGEFYAEDEEFETDGIEQFRWIIADYKTGAPTLRGWMRLERLG